MPSRVVATVIAVVLSASYAAACQDNREKFVDPAGSFPGATTDGSDCPLQCSLDGRSVVEACTGRVVEACPPELACGAAECLPACAAAAADRSSNGCDFYFQPPPILAPHAPGCNALYIVNTSIQPAAVSLELEGKSLDLSRASFRTSAGSAELIEHTGPIAPGESVVLFVSNVDPEVVTSFDVNYLVGCPNGVSPATLIKHVSDNTGVGSSFRLKTNVPVAATFIDPFGGAPSYSPAATLLLPVALWARENILVNGWDTGVGDPSVQIVASDDDTDVTIVPTHDIQDGRGVKGSRAWHPVTYRLNRGQYLQLIQDEELTGSFLTSSKPTTIFGGSSCANIPAGKLACDALMQQIPAFEQWGSEYVGVGYRPRTGNEHEPIPYRIVAARDGTHLDYDPEIPSGAPTTMNAGQVAMFRSGTGDAFVVRTQDAEHPIYVAAYMTGSENHASKGDPEFVNVVPVGQYLSSYSFFADPTYTDTSLVAVRARVLGEFKDVWLECAGTLTEWKPIGTRGDYEYVRVDLSREGGPGATFGTSVCQTGLQRMRSDGPFTATLWGWDKDASYAYPGGMAQRKLVQTPLVPIR